MSSADAIPVRDLDIRLYISAGSRSPQNYASSAGWPAGTFGAVSYGGPTDTWGRTWTAAQINSAGFGVGVRATMYFYPDPSTAHVGATAIVQGVSLMVTYRARWVASEPVPTSAQQPGGGLDVHLKATVWCCLGSSRRRGRGCRPSMRITCA